MPTSTSPSSHTTRPLQSPLLADVILDNAGMLIVVHDLSGRILRFNQACERLTGYTQDEVLNRTLWDFLLLPEEIPQVQELFKQLAVGQNLPKNHVNYWLTRRHEPRLISWYNTTIPPAGNPVDYIVSVGQDITETTDLKQRVSEAQELNKKTTAELRETESRYRTLVEQLPAVTYIAAVDEKASTLYYSPQVEQMLGYTPAEMCQSPDFWLNLIHPDDRPGILAEINQVLASKRPFHHEYRMCRKDGREVWINDDAAFVYDEHGRVRYQQGVMVDITATRHAQEELERRVVERTAELRESEERFRTAFEQAAVGMAHVSPDQRFLRVNQRMCEILGYSQEELLAKKFGDITYAEDLPGNLANLQRMINNETSNYTAEKRYICKDGSLVWVNIWVSMVRDSGGAPEYLTAIVEDISGRKQAQALLEERTRDLARSNAELEQFAYITSHDLQEPLRMVTNFAQLLARRYLGKLDERADDYIHYITEGAQRMNLLITDLLAYSRVGTRGRPFAEVDGEMVLNQALENLQMTIEEQGARITHDPLPVVQGDAIQLVQLLQNLISNAIKFRSSAPPLIHISAARREAEWVFSVRDNGIGIEPQYFERIFVIFQRLHLREEYPGTGIGLAICKKIIERHAGRIWVESNPDQGTTFYFSLPWNQSHSS